MSPSPTIGPAIPDPPPEAQLDGWKAAEQPSGDAAPSNSASRELLRPGMQLNGIFEIDAHLASGGMGEVYKGHSIQTGDKVAIKVIRAELVEDETAISLFRKEAAALFHLHHEAIVSYFVFSIDSLTYRAYLAMEFVEGELLSQVLKRGPLPLEDVCLLAERMALGLHAAHKQNIIHRDVSPDNIIVQNGDVREAKIIDFGIAASTPGGSETTIEVCFAGKYKYVSPEQLGLYGGEITPRSDIYSLGLVLLEALNGARTALGASPVEVIEKKKKLPDLDRVDERIRPLLKKMLDPNPSERPKSMLEVAEYVRHLPRTRIAPDARRAVGAIVILAVIGSGIFASILWRAPPSTPVERLPDITQQPPAEASGQEGRDETPSLHGGQNAAEPIGSTSAETKAPEAEGLSAERKAAAPLETEDPASEQREALRREVERLAVQKRLDAERSRRKNAKPIASPLSNGKSRLAAQKRDADRQRKNDDCGGPPRMGRDRGGQTGTATLDRRATKGDRMGSRAAGRSDSRTGPP